MKKYNVYGLGNALTDMEFEVEAEVLEKLGIDKGVMTLVEEDKQNQIISELNHLPCKKSSGGSAANTIVAVSQLGGKSFYSCKVADDEIGSFYLEDLLNSGVDTNLKVGQRESGITGKCLVFVTPDADRTMNTFIGISGELSENELVESALISSEYLYLEGYLVTSPSSKGAALKAKNIATNQGVKTVLSLSDPTMTKFFAKDLGEIIGSGLDFIFSNEAEALSISQTEDLSEAIAHLKTLAKGFAITLGPKGSLIFDGEKILEIPGVETKAVDTVGAGDMYAGAFLYGITHGLNYQDAGHLASKAAALVVSYFGARLSTEVVKSLIN